MTHDEMIAVIGAHKAGGDKRAGKSIWAVERDEYGFAVAVSCDGVYVLHLVPGTERNEENADIIVRALNDITQKVSKYLAREGE